MQKRLPAAAVKDMLAPLEKLYGAKRKVKQDTMLQQVLVGLLSVGTSTSNAVRALKLLGEEFVDWNELRISAPEEISEVLASCKVTPAAGRCVTRFLLALFEQTSALTLEFLEKEKPNAAYERLMGLSGAPPQAAAEAALGWFNAPFLPVDGELRRILARMGIIEKGATDQAVRRTLQRLVKRRDYYRFYHLLTDHAAIFCRHEEFDSEHCVLLSDCEMGQRHVVELERERQKQREAAEAAAQAQARAAAAQRAKAAAAAAQAASERVARKKLASDNKAKRRPAAKESPAPKVKAKPRPSAPKARSRPTAKRLSKSRK